MLCTKQYCKGESWGGDDEAASYTWLCKCVECVMKENDQSLQEAMTLIYEQSGSHRHRLPRAQKHRTSMTEFKMVFEAMGVSRSKRQLYQLCRESVEDLRWTHARRRLEAGGFPGDDGRP